MGKKRSLRIAARFEQVQKACDFVVEGAGLADDEAFHVRLACDEACTNIIEHAYTGEEKGEIVISWRKENGTLIITFFDYGHPFLPATIPEPDIPSPDEIDMLPIGGLGLHIIRQVMDDVQFEFSDKGNQLTVVKQLAD